ncbi:hypothetical protein [Alloscardovia criceti]|uniref:hypothetical protein n=1 Tax=Alloscardovia criceti TaxID=356828 RepID=UPI00037D6214|nr:hypothetical protein [Alloscardovia criceti]
MPATVDPLSQQLIDLLMKAGYEAEGELIEEIVQDGEWAVAQCIAIGYINRLNIPISRNLVVDVLDVAEQEDDAEAIEDCHFLERTL